MESVFEMGRNAQHNNVTCHGAAVESLRSFLRVGNGIAREEFNFF